MTCDGRSGRYGHSGLESSGAQEGNTVRESSGGLTGRDVVSSGLLERELGGKWGACVRLISSQVLLTCPPKV